MYSYKVCLVFLIKLFFVLLFEEVLEKNLANIMYTYDPFMTHQDNLRKCTSYC